MSDEDIWSAEFHFAAAQMKYQHVFGVHMAEVHA